MGCISEGMLDFENLIGVFASYNVDKNESQFDSFQCNSFFMWLCRFSDENVAIKNDLKKFNHVMKLMRT
jgi:hypothetical protein